MPEKIQVVTRKQRTHAFPDQAATVPSHTTHETPPPQVASSGSFSQKPAAPLSRPEQGQEAIYPWQDGDQAITAQIDKVANDNKGSLTKLAEIVPAVEGEQMSLSGGVVVTLNPAWTDDQASNFFAENGIAVKRVAETDFTASACVVSTAPGIPSLTLANTRATKGGVELTSPDRQMYLETLNRDPQYDQSDTREGASEIRLGRRRSTAASATPTSCTRSNSPSSTPPTSFSATLRVEAFAAVSSRLKADYATMGHCG